MPKALTQEEFIRRCRALYPNLDFSKAVYRGIMKPVIVICPKHGEYQMIANNLLHCSLVGCPQCGIEERKLTKEEFIRRATEKYGDKYDYSEVSLITSKSVVTVICPKHGPFKIRANNFMYKNKATGCPKCGKEGIYDSAK